MKNYKLQVGLDADEVLDDWWNPYVARFGLPKSDYEITSNCYKLRRDKEFWTTLPPLHKPNFQPKLICTKRSSRKEYLKQWLIENDYPVVPIYQVLYQYKSKAPYIKGRVDLFVDDSISNFLSINRAGIPCLLMDNPANQHLGPMLRVHSLDYEELEDVFYLAKKLDIFKDFNLYYGDR